MTVEGVRANQAQHTERVNAAAELTFGGLSAADAARVLGARFGVSYRQARRYVESAAASGVQPVPEATVSLTVKLPASMVDDVRRRARADGVTISGVVAAALARAGTSSGARGSGSGRGRTPR